MQFSDRLLRMKPSATRAMTDMAAKRKAEGLPTVTLTIGEPDFPSPQAAFRYAEKAMREERTHYTTTTGIRELRDAIAEYYRNEHGVSFGPDQICVGAGAKPLLFEAFGALVNKGSEVIIPTPAWVSYVEQIDVFDGKSVFVDTCDTGFIPDITAIENAVTDKTVAILINSPQNPTGVVYSRQLMADLCNLARRKNIMLINDEVYEQLTYGTRYVNPLADAPEAKDHVLSINGVSKAYAMTGWRIGYALGPSSLIAKMAVMQGHITSCASSVSQWASVGAIREGGEEAKAMVAEYARRMEYVYGELSIMPGIRVTKPTGAFYFFIDVRPSYGKTANGAVIKDDVAFCTELMAHGVALVPGTAFMSPGFARISYAASMDTLSEGMRLLRSFLENLE